MIYTCPHCETPVECGELTGTVSCPSCQGRFELSPVTRPPAAPPRAPTVSQTSVIDSWRRRSRKSSKLRWISLVTGGALFLAISVVALALLALRSGAAIGIAYPYKKAVRQHLSDNQAGKIIELEWGKVEELIGVRLKHRSNWGPWDTNMTHQSRFYFSPNSEVRRLKSDLPGAFFRYSASDIHKAAVREGLVKEGYSQVEEFDWRRTAPIPTISLKYKIETPAFGKSRAFVEEFYFKPESYEIFNIESVEP